MSSETDEARHYTTGEIALSMILVFGVLTLPTLAGLVYYLWYL